MYSNIFISFNIERIQNTVRELATEYIYRRIICLNNKTEKRHVMCGMFLIEQILKYTIGIHLNLLGK